MGYLGVGVEKPGLSTVRTNVCLVLHGMMPGDNPPAAAEEFAKRCLKAGLAVTIIGPRPKGRMGTKGVLKFLDRHEVVSVKSLARAKQQALELRILGRKLKAWMRLRADVCVVSGPQSVWPRAYEGWTAQGTMSLDAVARWVSEHELIPGRRFVYLGSSNRVLAWASKLLDMGAEACMVVEPAGRLRCWRAHADRFLSKGGRLFPAHELVKVQDRVGSSSAVFLRNAEGTMVLDADTVVMDSVSSEALSGPDTWQKGMYYIARGYSEKDPSVDEALVESQLDWSELYWRVARRLEVVDHGEATGALERIKEERKVIRRQRRPPLELNYSGKNLSKDTLDFIHSTGSAPAHFKHAKPMASLECLEQLVCRACVDACPHDAIEKNVLTDFPQLKPEACVGCGACVSACPAGAAVMVRELPSGHGARYFLPDDSQRLWRGSEPVQLLNRRGELLASGRVVGTTAHESGSRRVLEIESPAYNVWDGRAFRLPPTSSIADPVEPASNLERGWITLNGARRMAPLGVPITVALGVLGIRRFEDGLFCPDGGCRLCEVTQNGKARLACRSALKEGDALDVPVMPPSDHDCHCSGVNWEDVMRLEEGGVSQPVALEITGFGKGRCKGRWCASREGVDRTADESKVRPRWFGFDEDIWFELWPEDLRNER